MHSLFSCQSPTDDGSSRASYIESTPPRRGSEASIRQLTVKEQSLDPAPGSGEDRCVSSFEAAGVHVTVDDETLREQVSDPAALESWCILHPEDPRTVAYLRMLGRLDDAATAGRRSLAAEGLSPVMRAVRRARYAQVLQWQGAFVAAEEQLDLAAEETGLEDPTSPSSLSVLAGVFQHRAKCRFEHALAEHREGLHEAAARRWEAALGDARRALFMREGIGAADEGVIASSRQTLARLSRQDLAA